MWQIIIIIFKDMFNLTYAKVSFQHNGTTPTELVNMEAIYKTLLAS